MCILSSVQLRSENVSKQIFLLQNDTFTALHLDFLIMSSKKRKKNITRAVKKKSFSPFLDPESKI